MKVTDAISTCFAALAALSLATSASAQVNLDFVNVGDPGNPNDPATGYGAVSYNYQIGKYEVTLNQYTIREKFFETHATSFGKILRRRSMFKASSRKQFISKPSLRPSGRDRLSANLSSHVTP